MGFDPFKQTNSGGGLFGGKAIGNLPAPDYSWKDQGGNKIITPSQQAAQEQKPKNFFEETDEEKRRKLLKEAQDKANLERINKQKATIRPATKEESAKLKEVPQGADYVEPLGTKILRFLLPKVVEDSWLFKDLFNKTPAEKEVLAKEQQYQGLQREKRTETALTELAVKRPETLLDEPYTPPTTFLGKAKEATNVRNLVDTVKEGMLRPAIGYTVEMIGGQLGMPKVKEFGEKMATVSDRLFERSKVGQMLADIKSPLQGGLKDPRYYTTTIAQAVGLMGIATATGIATTASTGSPVAGMAASFGVVANIEQTSMYKSMVRKGLSPDESREASTIYGVAAGVLENILGFKPAQFATGAFGKVLEKVAVDSARKGLVRQLLQVPVEESFEEMAQQFTQNLLTSSVDKDQKLWDQIIDSGIGGFVGSLPLGGGEVIVGRYFTNSNDQIEKTAEQALMDTQKLETYAKDNPSLTNDSEFTQSLDAHAEAVEQHIAENTNRVIDTDTLKVDVVPFGEKFAVGYQATLGDHLIAGEVNKSELFDTEKQAVQFVANQIEGQASTVPNLDPKVLTTIRQAIAPALRGQTATVEVKPTQESAKPAEAVQPEVADDLEAMKSVNPMLFKHADQSKTVDEFIKRVAKSSNTSVKNISVENLTEWYNRVKKAQGATPPAGKKSEALPELPPDKAEFGQVVNGEVVVNGTTVPFTYTPPTAERSYMPVHFVFQSEGANPISETGYRSEFISVAPSAIAEQFDTVQEAAQDLANNLVGRETTTTQKEKVKKAVTGKAKTEQAKSIVDGKVMSAIIDYKMLPADEETRGGIAKAIVELATENPDEAKRLNTLSREYLKNAVGSPIYRAGGKEGMSWTFDESVADMYKNVGEGREVIEQEFTQELLDRTLFYDGIPEKVLGFKWNDYKDSFYEVGFQDEDEVLILPTAIIGEVSQQVEPTQKPKTPKPVTSATEPALVLGTKPAVIREAEGDVNAKGKKPLFGRPELKTIITSIPDFADRPILTVKEVDGEKVLAWESGKTNINIKMSALGLDPDTLAEGVQVKLIKDYLTTDSNELAVFDPAIKVEPKTPRIPSNVNASMGAVSISAFENILGEQPTVDDFKLFEQVQKLIKRYASRVFEGHLPKGAAGVYIPSTRNIGLSGLNDLSVASHEIGHWLDYDQNITNKIMEVVGYNTEGDPLYDAKYSALRKEMTDLYVNYYPTGRRTHKLRKRMVEGFATLLQKYIEIPTLIGADYPNIVREFLTPQGQFYKSVIGDIINDIRGIVAKYQSLDELSKIGSRVTSQPVEAKSTFFNLWDTIVETVADRIVRVEKVARKAGVHMTEADPSLHLRLFNNQQAIFGNNTLTDRGYWGLRNGEWKRLYDFNWGTLGKKLTKAKASDTFGYYLVARRIHFDYADLEELNQQVATMAEAAKEMTPTELNAKDENGRSFRQEVQEVMTQQAELSAMLKRDGISQEEADKAYLDNQDTFKEYEEMYDTLVQEDIKLLSQPEIGLVKPDEAKRLLSQKGYASFKRAFYNEVIGEPVDTGLRRPSRFGKVSSLIKRKGSSRAILNPVFSAITNHAEILRKAMAQKVFNTIGDIAESATLPDLFQIDQLRSFVDDTGRIMYPQEKDPAMIMARINYKRVPIQVDTLVKRAIDEALATDQMGQFERALLFASRMFTKGTTGLFPQFAVSNLLVDQVTATVNTQTKQFLPVISSFGKLVKLMSKKMGASERAYLTEYLVLGGDKQTFINHMDLSPQELTMKLAGEKNALERTYEAVEKATEVTVGLLPKWSEILTRSTEYINARKEGDPQIVALEKAGRVSVPFHHIGRWGSNFGRVFIRTMPYFNAGVQVLSQTTRTLGTRKGKQRFAVVVGLITASMMSSLALIAGAGSDDQKNEYKDLSAEDLARYLYLPKRGGIGLVKIRIAQEYAFIGALLNMMIADQVFNANYSGYEYLQALTSPLPDQVNIFDPARMLMGWIPQLLKPAVETSLNVKTYPDVRPIESEGMKFKAPSERYNQNTSRFARWLGKTFDISPLKADYLLTGYFGRTGGFLFVKPSAYNFTSSWNQDYYLTSGRRFVKYYKMRSTNDIEWKRLQTGVGKYDTQQSGAISDWHYKSNQLDKLMTEFKKVDTDVQSTSALDMRTEILTILDDLTM